MNGRGSAIAGALAGLTGITLVVAFIAPFYGALDKPVAILEAGETGGENSGIVVEQFDYNEPDAEASLPSVNASDAGTLEREEPRPPLSELGQASAPKPAEPTPPPAGVDESEPMRLLPLPVAVAAGRLENQRLVIDLEGIEIIPADGECTASSGGIWPCGMHARTAFRQWLRARAIMCRLPDDGDAQALTTQCKIGNEDAALWLVSNGWAKALPGSAYAEAGRNAEDGRRGIYGEKPSAVLPELNATPMPSEQAVPGVMTAPLPPVEGEFPPVPAPPAH